MPPAVRTRLPALLAAAALIEFELEVVVAVPAGTPHRGLVAMLLPLVVLALFAARRAPLTALLVATGFIVLAPALSPAYYEHMALPFATPFLAAFWLGARADRGQLVAGLVAGAAL